MSRTETLVNIAAVIAVVAYFALMQMVFKDPLTAVGAGILIGFAALGTVMWFASKADTLNAEPVPVRRGSVLRRAKLLPTGTEIIRKLPGTNSWEARLPDGSMTIIVDD